MLEVRSVCGLGGRLNIMLVAAASRIPATSSVLLLPGDLSDLEDVMISKPDTNQWAEQSLEKICKRFCARFPTSHIFVVRPCQFTLMFAVYRNFVDVDEWGHPEVRRLDPNTNHVQSFVAGTRALHHLVHLLHNAAHDRPLLANASSLPLHLVAFSKGVVPCSQIVADIAFLHKHTTTAQSRHQHHQQLQLVQRLQSIHLVDPGLNVSGLLPTSPEILSDFASFISTQGTKIRIHTTPWFFDKSRPWIAGECTSFVSSLQALGIDAKQNDLLKHEKPSLACHFALLDAFDLFK